MKFTNTHLSRSILIGVFVGFALSTAGAQDLDHLDITDTTMAVVRYIPMQHLEAELDAISTLITEYEREKRDSDHHKQLVRKALEAIEKEIDITKSKIDLAKKEERMDDRDSLEVHKENLEAEKDYFERAVETREYERRHAEALVDWTRQVRKYFEKATQLMEERERQGRQRDLLTLERETIEEQEKAAERMKKVGDEMLRVAKRRESMYKERQKLLEALE
jgi:hypothetical protein